MGQTATRLRSFVGAYPELLSVLAAAAVRLTVQAPLAWLASHQGIDVLLAVLVFATALTIEPSSLRRLGGTWRPLLAAVTTGIVVLPALSWVASRLVAAGSLRNGVMVAGLAPCEIASVAPYFAIALALVAFLAASAGLGRLLGLRTRPPAGRALLLTTSMRDFAIAADLAVAAFGPAAAAPLGLYGILVLICGTAAAGVLRQRQTVGPGSAASSARAASLDAGDPPAA